MVKFKSLFSHPLFFLLLFMSTHFCYLWESTSWFTLQVILQLCILFLGLSFSATRLFAVGMGAIFLMQTSPYLMPNPQMPEQCITKSQHLQGIAKKPSFAVKNSISLQKVTLSCEGVQYHFLEASIPLQEGQKLKGWYLTGERIKVKHFTIIGIDLHSLSAKQKPLFRAYNLTREQAQLDRSSFFYHLKNKASYFLSEQANGLYQALSIANKEFLQPAQKEVIQKLGLSHLFAISGMHIGILFIWLRYLFSRTIPLPTRIVEKGRQGLVLDLMSLFCIISYIQLIGVPISALRSTEMLLWWILMRHLFPYQPLWVILVGVANIILLINPLYIASISFQLSFISVFAIFLILDFLPEIHIHTVWWKRLLYPIYSSLLLTGWIFIFLFPLTLNYFQGVSLFSIPSNLIHITFMSLLFLPIAEATMILTLLIKPFSNLELEWLLYQPVQILGGLWAKLLEVNSYFMDSMMMEKTNWPWWAIGIYWGGLILLRNFALQRQQQTERITIIQPSEPKKPAKQEIKP